MLHKQTGKILFITLFLIIGIAGLGSATIISDTYDLTIATIAPANPYGLSDGATVTVGYTIDTADGYLDSGYSFHTGPLSTSIAQDASFLFSLTFGNTTYTGSDDLLWPELPSITFRDITTDATGEWTSWVVDNISFETIDYIRQYWIEISTINPGDPITIQAAPIPEPATIMLFGIGLLGLAGITRKSR